MLLLSVMSIWFVTSGRIRLIYRKFVFIFLALLALPWMADMLAKLTYPTFAWRWLWIAPVSLFASIAVAGLFGMVRERSQPDICGRVACRFVNCFHSDGSSNSHFRE